MARQSMHGDLLRNHTSIAKFTNRRQSNSTKWPEQHRPRILVDETSFFVLEGTTKCAYVTYLTFGPDGQWTRVLSLPAECFDKFIDLDMDGLCVVSPAPIIPFSVNHPRYLRSIWHTYSGNPVAEAKLSGIVRQRGSQQKALANNSGKPNVSPSCCAVWSDIMPCVTDTTSLSENCKVPRRKSKKKAKKKRKQSKKLHSDAGLMEAEALSAPLSNGISTTESYVGYNMELDGSVPNTADLVKSSSGLYDTQAVRGDRFSHLDKFSPACLMDTQLDMSHKSASQAFNTEEYDHSGAAKNTLRQQINWFECDTEASYGNHDSIVSDSGFTCLNSVDSGDTICDLTNSGPFISPETSTFVGNSVSSESSSILSVEYSTRRKGRKIGSKESCGSDVPMYAQRSNHMNSMPGRCANKRAAHGHFGKENLHSVWKKVHKTDSSSVYSVEKNNNMSLDVCVTVTSRDNPRHEGYCHVAKKLSAADDSNSFQVNISRRPKNRIAHESQQKGSYPSGKEYLPKKGRSSMLQKVNQENGRSFSDAAQNKIKQARGSNWKHHILSNSSRVELNNKVDITARTTVPGIKVYPQDLLVSEMTLTTNGKIDAQTLEVKCSLSTESDGFIGLSNCLDQTQKGQIALKEDEKHLEKEASSSTNGKKDYNSGFVLQKWIPVGRKVPCPTGLERSDTSLLLHFDKPDAVNGCSRISTDLCDSISSVTSDIREPSPIFEKLHNSEEDISEFKMLKSEAMVMSDSERNIGSLVSGVKEVQISPSDSFLKKITSAVEETYRIQMESEAVQAASGTTIAGFEKFLQSACPVILKVDSALKCQRCHTEPAAISFLCKHELQSVSLGNLWEWYERHGSYGLEVIEDRYDDPSKLGQREFGARAYFVPYLSAVQLFRKCRNGYVNGLKCLRPGIPHPCTGTVGLSHLDQPRSRQQCCELVENNAIAQSAGSTESYELIFEYFESEQPRGRQPLFDKIKELAGGEGSQQKVYGDPKILSSSDICDLYPRSWYSVAWYPIYKIPDGKFRAAFLTYHSLGHLVHRESSSNSSEVEIVSPIVGLLSCNAQCEGWFQPIDSELKKPLDTRNLSLRETINERLRTLEDTASLLAKATVRKGNITSVNRHPDYGFFTSRRG